MDRDPRYLRQLVLEEFGPVGQRRLGRSSVAVVGAGGLGSPLLSYLAAAGVGTLTVIDDDQVELTNLHRQVIHRTAAVGSPKVDSARRTLEELNPHPTIVTRRVRLSAENAADLLRGHDVIVDGSDNFPTRLLIDETAAALGTPVVWGSLLRFDGQLTVFDAARGLRYRDVFPQSPPDAASCTTAGVLGPVCGMVGSAMALETLKVLCGIGEDLFGRLLVLDGLTHRWREIPLRPQSRATTTAAPRPPRVAHPTMDLMARLDGPGAPQVVDLREPQVARRHPFPRSRLIHLTEVLAGTHGLSREEDYLVVCEAGRRSLLAVRILAEDGFTRVAHLPGGEAAVLAELGGQPWPWSE